MTMESCPNCGKKISASIWNANSLYKNEEITQIVNEILQKNVSHYCGSCIGAEQQEAFKVAHIDIEAKQAELQRIVENVRIVSAQSPADWDYTSLEIVTAHVVLGSGLFTEISSSFSDLFGMQSDSWTAKIRESENLCFWQIKRQTIEKGGNAVVAVDIDYNEVGGSKAMIMVCITGTAVILKGAEQLADSYTTLQNEWERLEQMKQTLVSAG